MQQVVLRRRFNCLAGNLQARMSAMNVFNPRILERLLMERVLSVAPANQLSMMVVWVWLWLGVLTGVFDKRKMPFEGSASDTTNS